MTKDAENVGRLMSFVHRACDVMHLAAEVLKDKEMPSAADALHEQAIMLTDFVTALEEAESTR